MGSLTNPALATLGMTRGQLTAAGLTEAGAATAIGAVLAAGVAGVARSRSALRHCARSGGTSGRRSR